MLPLRIYNPSFGVPAVNWVLLVINSTVFFYLLALPHEKAIEAMVAFGAAPADIWVGSKLWGLVTGMFVHDVTRIPHIVFNMVTLALFGGNIEGELGHCRYLFFYLLGGFFAALAHISTYPDQETAMVGASGAISAVMGAYLVIYPRRTILFFTPFLGLLRQPIVIYMIVWLTAQIVIGVWWQNDQIAWFAHLGGFIAGIALVKPMLALKSRSPMIGSSRPRTERSGPRSETIS